MTLKLDNTVIPPLPTRKEVCEILGLSMAEVKRLDYDGHIRRSPAFGCPVRYVGESIRDFAQRGQR
jgi:predicted site-specific integrase-resolvase